MPAAEISFHLSDDEMTARLGRWLAPRLAAGDVLLLEGVIGAGKSHLARALIRARLGREEDVPSPTFTLVQTYEAGGVDIWHADLYRLSLPDEVVELGLEAAFADSICLIEWPDRLGSLTPADALRLRLQLEGEARRATVSTSTAPRHAALLAALTQDWAVAPERAGHDAAGQDGPVAASPQHQMRPETTDPEGCER